MNTNNNKGVFSMTTTAQKWGNSIGVRIPKILAKKYEIENGSELEISESENGIMLKPVMKKPTLEELVAKCDPENSHEEIDFGGSVGKELI